MTTLKNRWRFSQFHLQAINEGVLDSILPYIGYKKPSKTTSVYTPIIKKTSSNAADIKKLASFGGKTISAYRMIKAQKWV